MSASANRSRGPTYAAAAASMERERSSPTVSGVEEAVGVG